MNWLKTGKYAAEAAILLALAVFLLSGLLAWRAVDSGRELIFSDMESRASELAKRAGMAMYPAVEPFFLHAAVGIITSDKSVGFAVVSDRRGVVRSHSDPELIGEPDDSEAGRAARAYPRAARQSYRGADGRTYHYFSSPIIVGRRRVGTAALAVDSETMAERLAPLRHRLWIILAVMALVMALLQLVRFLLGKVARAAELKSAMIHTVSHEFNNALASLEGGVFLLKEGDPQRERSPRAEMYRMITEVQGSLRLFVQTILNEARMDSGKFRAEKREVLLKELAEKCVAGLEPVIRHKNIRLLIDRPEPVPVHADREALALVVSNLLGNAVKYTQEGGSITVRIGREGGRPGKVLFSVVNSGPGLKPEEITQIRRGFYRTSDGKARSSGFGLGMRIVGELLELHGARLDIESEPGKRTAFSFALPEYGEKRGGA